MKTIQFELITPEEKLMDTAASLVVMPGVEGYLGVLPDHAPMVVELGVGIVDIFVGGKVEERIYVNSGFADISPEKCVLLVESATPLSSVDRAQLSQTVENLENVVKNATVDTVRETAQVKLLEARVMKNALDTGPAISSYSG